MSVTVFRIDDRLIHGQIVTAWLAHAEAKHIVVADDKASTDSLQQTLLKMATPKGVKLSIKPVKEAIELLVEETSTNILLLVRGPESAIEIVRAIPELNKINVGNINMKKGKKKVLDNLWVDDVEISQLRELGQLATLEVRAVPNDRSQLVVDLLDKEGL